MIGYLDKDDLVVVDASGPGPRAELRPYSVLIDGIYAGKYCARAVRESCGKLDYVGDWHCHLWFSHKASEQDHIAMKTMAEFDGAPTKTPISLIWAKYRDVFGTYIFTEDGKLKPVPSIETKSPGKPGAKEFL